MTLLLAGRLSTGNVTFKCQDMLDDDKIADIKKALLHLKNHLQSHLDEKNYFEIASSQMHAYIN